jgi:phage tail-like protein
MARRTGDFPDPYANFNFMLEIDGITVAGFSEVTGLNAESTPIEYREGNEALTTRKLPGLLKYSNLTLKRGVTDQKDLFEWVKTVEDGDVRRLKSMSVVLLDEQRNEAARWNLRFAWPTKYTVPDLKANANEIAIETLELCHEGLERQK